MRSRRSQPPSQDTEPGHPQCQPGLPGTFPTKLNLAEHYAAVATTSSSSSCPLFPHPVHPPTTVPTYPWAWGHTSCTLSEGGLQSHSLSAPSPL